MFELKLRLGQLPGAILAPPLIPEIDVVPVEPRTLLVERLCGADQTDYRRHLVDLPNRADNPIGILLQDLSSSRADHGESIPPRDKPDG
jgi:hypothetical protein